MPAQSKKRILVLASHPDSFLNFRKDLLRLFINRKLEVHVAAPDLSSSDQRLYQLKELGVHAHDLYLKRTGINPFHDAYSLICIFRLIYKIKPNYLLSYTIKPVVYGNICGWALGVPKKFALVTGLGYSFQGVNRQRIWIKSIATSLYRWSLKTVDIVFFQNSDDEELFLNLGLVDQKKTRTVVTNGSGVNLKEFPTTGLPKKINFLLIARLLGDKGVREFANAAKAVKRYYPDVTFSIAGWIDENPDAISAEELQNWVKSGYINYLGYMENVQTTISNSSVYVLPSYREGTPRTILEAMSMGRPIITTDVPGCRETVIDGKNGFLIPSKNVDLLADAMFKFIRSPDLIFVMGEQSRRLAEKKYDVKKVNAKILVEMEI